MSRIVFSVLVVGLVSGCGDKFQLKQRPYDGVHPLIASKTQIVNQLDKLGKLDGVQVSSIDRNYEVVSAKDETQYFVKEGRVVSYIRAPQGDESKILYWRYRFKDQLYRETDLPRDGQLGHRLPMRQMICDALGIGVIFDPSTKTVKRIFHYEQK